MSLRDRKKEGNRLFSKRTSENVFKFQEERFRFYIFKKGFYGKYSEKPEQFAQRGKIYHDVGWLSKHKYLISSL